MSNKNNLDNIISLVEEKFLAFGAERMSKYFGDEIFQNGMAAEHVLWNKDDLYYMVCAMPLEVCSVQIKYSESLAEGYEFLAAIPVDISEAKLSSYVEKIMDGWTPKEEEVLNKYIELYDKNPFPYNVKNIVIYNGLGEEKETCFFVRNVEKERIDYERNLSLELDIAYFEYRKKLEDGDVEGAFGNLCKLYRSAYERLGAEHSNTIALLYEFTIFFEFYFSYENLLNMNLSIYKFVQNRYGNRQLLTLSIISAMASCLCEMEKYKDGILLAKFVYKVFKKKFGENTKKTRDAQGCLVWHYYRAGMYGKALSEAELCLNKCNADEKEDIVYYKTFIAKIHKMEHFEDYEQALKYDLEALYEIESCEWNDINQRISLMDSVAEDYLQLNMLEEAIELQTNVIEAAVRVYGLDDIRTLRYHSNLSFILTAAGDYEEALKLDSGIFSRYIEVLGRFHEDTLRVKNDIIIDLVNLGAKEIAMKAAKDEYILRKEKLGQEHEATLYSWQQYMDLYEDKWY